MNYSPDAFTALHQSAERHGGALLDDPCLSEDVERTTKQGYIRNKIDRKTTCGCGHNSRFVLPYEGEEDDKRARFVTACAVCDAVGAWPKFCKDVYAADPGMDPLLDDQEEEDGS